MFVEKIRLKISLFFCFVSFIITKSYYVQLLKCEQSYYGQQSCSKQDSLDMWIDLIRSVNEDSLNFACGDYNEHTDRCDTIGEPDFSRKNSSIKVDKRFNSFMVTALELFESLA